jgi:hypothetical protein
MFRRHGSRPARGTRRRGAIVSLRLAHSAIFLVNSASILHIFWAGVRGRPSRWTGPALAAALTESAVLVANRGRCPLRGLAEGLGAESGRVSDLFLARWFADRLPQLCGPLLLIGLLGLLRHGRRDRTRATREHARQGGLAAREAVVGAPA